MSRHNLWCRTNGDMKDVRISLVDWTGNNSANTNYCSEGNRTVLIYLQTYTWHCRKQQQRENDAARGSTARLISSYSPKCEYPNPESEYLGINNHLNKVHSARIFRFSWRICSVSNKKESTHIISFEGATEYCGSANINTCYRAVRWALKSSTFNI